MPTYQYTACQRTGAKVSGTLTAVSRQEALGVLSKQTLLPVSVSEVVERKATTGRVPAQARAAMFELLADLLESGVSLLNAMTILVDQTSHPALKATLSDLRDQVADGRGLADAMATHRSVFSDLVVSMIRAGEEGGFLEEALQRLARFTERQEELRSRVIGAIAYPAFLAVAGVVVVTGMLTFFVPKFGPLFQRMRERGTLPQATQWLLATSDLLRQHGIWLGVILVTGIVWLRHWMQAPEARRQVDQCLLSCKGVGPVVRSLALARFCRILGTLLKNGVPLLKSLKIARDATGNRVLSDAIGLAAENVSSGKTLAEPLRACGQFPRELLEMITVGEQANRLESILLDLADKLENRTQRRLDMLLKLLEPCLMLVMAIVIGFLVVALLMPVFEGSGTMM